MNDTITLARRDIHDGGGSQGHVGLQRSGDRRLGPDGGLLQRAAEADANPHGHPGGGAGVHVRFGDRSDLQAADGRPGDSRLKDGYWVRIEDNLIAQRWWATSWDEITIEGVSTGNSEIYISRNQIKSGADVGVKLWGPSTSANVNDTSSTTTIISVTGAMPAFSATAPCRFS